VLLLDPLGDAWCGEAERAAVTEFLREHRVSAVLAEFLDVWIDLIPTLVQVGTPVWGHAHGYDVSSRLRDEWWCQAYAGWTAATGVVTMSEVSRQRLSSVATVGRVEVVSYGVDVPAAVPQRSSVDTCTVVAVGRLVPKKSPVTAVRAFERAARTRPQLRMVIAGAGPLHEDVCAAAGARVDVPGEVTSQQVQELLGRADVFAQHSVVDPATGDEEGLPVAILEAMAAGLPVVATRHAGIPEAVLDGVTGLLVEEGDEVGMAEAIGRLADDPDLRRAMGRAGWERARDLFTWERERAALRGLLWPGGPPDL
jgi:glycosyltransferase involved in cell wall biosynthesis